MVERHGIDKHEKICYHLYNSIIDDGIVRLIYCLHKYNIELQMLQSVTVVCNRYIRKTNFRPQCNLTSKDIL